jgi:hypothetical protein
MSKKGQVTMFIIVAIIIIVLGISFFVFKDNIITPNLPQNIEGLENNFLSCLREELKSGSEFLKLNGGYIENPSFVSGSDYMPFSSELSFFGLEIPYWYFISGNNIEYSRVPTIENMEEELSSYLFERISSCDLEEYRSNGYFIEFGEAEVEVVIKDESIVADLEMNIFIERNGETFSIKDHSVEVDSSLGILYEDALEVYNYEQESYFLENYSVDVLRNYLPVDGIEISCSPLTWDAYELYEEFTQAMEDNILSLKNKGDERDYFALNLPVDSELKFITFKDWPNTFEVNPTEGDNLVAKPIGNQAGLGILGFCYIPYHFVYDYRYPILVQVSRGEEIFQFPVAVIIDGNVARESRADESYSVSTPNLCENSNTNISISLYNNDLEEVDGTVSFDCISSECSVGETQKGFIEGKVPQCVNGLLKVNSLGYKDYSQTISTIEEGQFIIILDKEYEKEIILYEEGVPYRGDAIVSFISEESPQTISYPSQNKVLLSEGSYKINVNLISSSSIEIPKYSKEECVEVPRPGFGALFGLTSEECREVEVEEQEINGLISGGGLSDYYFLENELDSPSSIIIDVEDLGVPESLDELQENYLLVDSLELEVSFR